ncbi:hypothetical protein, partial [Roseibium sp. TrichSKD4]|uniref:hypothetical protein n=1 Tax=Roseibium sp. TrichSKD4 TaxID=744980 RepID=UPI001AD9203C
RTPHMGGSICSDTTETTNRTDQRNDRGDKRLFCRYPNWLERLGEFCDALDAIDLAELRTMAKQGPGIDGKPPKQRMLLAGYLQYLLEDIMEPPEQKEMPLWMTG